MRGACGRVRGRQQSTIAARSPGHSGLCIVPGLEVIGEWFEFTDLRRMARVM
jgi:hypothetical protein